MKHIIGIDVAKLELVIYCQGKSFTITNSERALKDWFKRHQDAIKAVKLIAFEPTGGYERCLRKYLDAQALPYKMIHANHIRAYAKATGVLAKTDKIDAKIIAEFAQVMGVKPSATIQQYPQLKVLLDRRAQLVLMRNEERNRLDTSDKLMYKMINTHIKWLDKQIKKLEEQMKSYIEGDAKLVTTIKLYESIPGMGWLTSLRLIVDLPELTSHDDKKLAALVGLAPFNRDSGKTFKRRSIMAGRTKVRSALYLATFSAMRYNSVVKTFYERLRLKGKPGKVAVVAAAHKLLFIVRSIAQRRTPWVEIY